MTFQCVCDGLCSVPVELCLFFSHFCKHAPVAGSSAPMLAICYERGGIKTCQCIAT